MATHTATYAQQGLMPAHSPEVAVTGSVALPRGGPTDSGGSFAKGLGLGMVGGTAQPEIWTISTTLADGTFTFHFVSARGVKKTAALAYNVSTANLKTALTTLFGDGKIATVTGTAGTEYVITFADNARMGGHVYFAETASSGEISVARTQRGSVGAGQFDVYDGSGVTTIDRLLERETLINEQGGQASEWSDGTDNPYSPPAWREGFFYAADIPNIASGAVGNDKKLGYDVGSSVSAAGTILRLSQKT